MVVPDQQGAGERDRIAAIALGQKLEFGRLAQSLEEGGVRRNRKLGLVDAFEIFAGQRGGRSAGDRGVIERHSQRLFDLAFEHERDRCGRVGFGAALDP